MGSKIKKVVLCLLVAAMVSAPAVSFADTGTQTQTVQTQTQTKTDMTIDEVIDYAMENAPSVITKTAAVQLANEQFVYAKSNYRKYSTMTAMSDEMYLIKSGYRQQEAEIALQNAEAALASEKYSVRTAVYTAFYTYLSYDEKIKIYEDALNQAQTRLEQAQSKLDNGTISELNMDSFKLSVLTAKNNLADAKRKQSEQLLSLKTKIGYPTAQELTLTGDLSKADDELSVLPLDKAVEATMNKNTNVVSIKNSLVLLDEMMDTYTKWYTSNTYTYRIQKASYEAQKAAYNESLSGFEYNVTSLYNGIESINESIDAMTMNISIAEKAAKVKSAQFDMGLCTADDVIEQEQQLTQLKNTLVDLKVSLLSTMRAYASMYDSTENTSVTSGN